MDLIEGARSLPVGGTRCSLLLANLLCCSLQAGLSVPFDNTVMYCNAKKTVPLRLRLRVLLGVLQHALI